MRPPLSSPARCTSHKRTWVSIDRSPLSTFYEHCKRTRLPLLSRLRAQTVHHDERSHIFTSAKISLAAFLLTIPAAVVAQGSCDLFNDPCQFTLDLECDDPTGLNLCPANSDCFDCDPFQQFQGCDACIANGGRYCETALGTPVCSDPAIAALAPNACFGGGGTTVRVHLQWFRVSIHQR